MYAAVVLFATLGLDPFLAVLPVAAVFFALGYALQAGLINPFITRPEHSQFMLLVAVALIMVNALLIAFRAERAQRAARLPARIDRARAAAARPGKVYAALVALVASALLFAFFKLTRTGKAIRACADNYLGAKGRRTQRQAPVRADVRPGLGLRGGGRCMMVLLVDVTPVLGPAYTLLAFVIVIVGGPRLDDGCAARRRADRRLEALAGLFITPSAKSMVSFGLLILVLLLRPQGLLGKKHESRARLLALLVACLAALPLVANSYVLSVATLILFFAFAGQAWNVMMGFAGQLSLGHSLYVGVGAYAAAGLYFHFRPRRVGRNLARDRALRAARRGDRVSRVPLRHFRRLLRAADDRVRRIHAHRVRPHRVARRARRTLHQGGAPGRLGSRQPARRAGDVLLRHARAHRSGVRAVRRTAPLAGRLLLAGDPRERRKPRRRSASIRFAGRCSPS
jgi:branched-chain amino acid transport system permease protein